MQDHMENFNRNMETIINDQVEMENKKHKKVDKKTPLSVSSIDLMQTMKELVNLKTGQQKLQKRKKGEELQDGGRIRRGDHLPPDKYIYMWNNSYRTPTECWQKTSDLPKGNKIPT